MTRLQLSSPCGCRRTLGTRDQLHGRALPNTQAAPHPTGPCMAQPWDLAVFGSLISQKSNVFDLFGSFSGAFYLPVPCLKPKQMSLKYFLKFSVPKPYMNSVTSLFWGL